MQVKLTKLQSTWKVRGMKMRKHGDGEFSSHHLGHKVRTHHPKMGYQYVGAHQEALIQTGVVGNLGLISTTQIQLQEDYPQNIGRMRKED